MNNYQSSVERRRKLRELQLCINSSLPGARRWTRQRVEHGPLVPGEVRCARCKAIHAKSRGESGGSVKEWARRQP